MNIDAKGLSHRMLNERLREWVSTNPQKKMTITHCMGQRFIASGMSCVDVDIDGIPGNALGCFLSSGSLRVNGNAQDAVGDTMSGGTIVIHGSAGDALGYAMRGGRIFVKGDAGYRAGIHMKQHEGIEPCIIIGGKARCFLGEYQAGGTILVLGIDCDGQPPIGAFCGTGMHGGVIYVRSSQKPNRLSKQVRVQEASLDDRSIISSLIEAYCIHFNASSASLKEDSFWRLSPDDQNPYHRLYTPN